MVVDVQLFRAPGQPFGFRLIGGRDFEIPLTVSRVVESSIAQASGLQEGDVVVRINDDPTIEMTHEDAHVNLIAAGDSFVLGVLRATDVLAQQEAAASVASLEETELQQEQIDKIIPDKPVTDEEIAELLSGEAEVLKEHGVLGVNFNRMMPKSGVFKRSEVFQALNEAQQKTKEEIESELRGWTTFLQKPNRPVPTSSNNRIITSTYKPVIVKQPKPKCAPDYRVTPSPSPQPFHADEEVEEVETVKQENEIEVKVEENCCERERVEEIVVAEMSSETTVTYSTTTESAVTFEEIAAEATGEVANEELVAEEIKSQSDEVSVVSSAFAEQLANVQSQLMALSHLPKTIQSTLDEITKQLQSLIPTPKLKQKSVEPESKATDEEKVVTNEEAKETLSEAQQQQNCEETSTTTTTTVEEITINQTTEITMADTAVVTQQEAPQAQNNETEEHHPTNDEIEEYEESQRKFRELWEKKREKEPVDAKTELSAELKQKVSEDRTSKQKKAKNFRGLQPAERPIILPGGRKWKNAKDAMNDELIAEIISSQAELIMGTTLGVNFLKYQKPEKDLSFLKNSETYRTIHHLTPHENGIEKRPAMVAAEQDVLKCASPNPLNQNSS